jgi:hypothetical protein
MKQDDLTACKECGGTVFTALSEHEDHGSFFFGPAAGPRIVVVLQCECGAKYAKVTAQTSDTKAK